MTRCKHCSVTLAPYEQDEDEDTLRGLCAQCADSAVYGEPCGICGRVPANRGKSCDWEPSR